MTDIPAAERSFVESVRKQLEELHGRLAADSLPPGGGAGRAEILASWRSARDAYARLRDVALALPEEQRGLTRLLGAVAGVLEESAAAERLEEDRRSWRVPAAVPGASPMEPASIRTALLREQDRGRREMLAAVWDDGARGRFPRLSAALGQAWDASRRLGPEDYVAAWEERRGAAIAPLLANARAFLSSTADLLRDACREAATRTVSRGPYRWHDLLHGTFAGPIVGALPPGHVPVACKLFLGSAGIDASAGGRVRLHLEELPGVPPAPHVVAVRVPGEVHALVPATGGLPDVRGVLRVLGEALALAAVEPSLPYEDRLSGGVASRTFGVLLESLAGNRVWLRKIAKVDRPRDAARAPWLLTLLQMREDAASLVGQAELSAAGSLVSAEPLARDLVASAWGVTPPGDAVLRPLAPGLSAATDIAAWGFAFALQDHLEEGLDEDWFRNPRLGGYLRSLWAEGARVDLAAVTGRPGTILEAVPALERALG